MRTVKDLIAQAKKYRCEADALCLLYKLYTSPIEARITEILQNPKSLPCYKIDIQYFELARLQKELDSCKAAVKTRLIELKVTHYSFSENEFWLEALKIMQ